MKTLLLMRHAKSTWDEPDVSDHDRPLDDRGRREAPRMAVWLADQQLIPDAIITSSATRAATTAELVAKTLPEAVEITVDRRLYHATPDGYLEVIRQFDSSLARPLVVGHNPGLEELIYVLCGTAATMSTAMIAQLAPDISQWSALNGSTTVQLVQLGSPLQA
jgi:phosphohistidine phosphatase